MRCYVSCFLCWGRCFLTGLCGVFLWRQSLWTCVNTCEHVTAFETASDHLVTSSLAVICKISTVFCPFSTLYLPSRSVFGFPFLPCSVYLYCSGLLVGLVFPTFSLYGTRQGSETGEKGKTVKWIGRKEEEMDAKQAERQRKRGSQDGPRAGKRGARLAS